MLSAMKTFAVVLISLAVAAGLVWAGWRLGYRHAVLEQAATEQTFDMNVLRAKLITERLEGLQAGDVTKLRDDFAFELYWNVARMDELFDRAHPEWQKQAAGLAKLIAEHHDRWATNYTTEMARESDKGLITKVDSILKRSAKNQRRSN